MKHVPNGLLLLVFIGFIASYPFHATFWGGLTFSFCCAALVGGIADWFAVTALYKKPLGIPPLPRRSKRPLIRTNIIIENRERLFHEMVLLVETDLLSKTHLQRSLRHLSFVSILLDYLQQHGGKDDLWRLSDDIFRDMTKHVQHDEMSRFLQQWLDDNSARIPLTPVLVKLLRLALDSGYDAKMINGLLDEALKFNETDIMRDLLIDFVVRVKSTYEKDTWNRRLFNSVILSRFLNLSNEAIVQYIRTAITNLLSSMKDNKHPLRQTIHERMEQWIVTLETDEATISTIERWKTAQLRKLNVHQFVAHQYEQFLTKHPTMPDSWRTLANDQLNAFAANEGARRLVEQWIQARLQTWIEEKHTLVGQLVRENLNQFSNDDLVQLIHDKAGRDLQMIRINGTLVGGFVGALLHFITHWAF